MSANVDELMHLAEVVSRVKKSWSGDPAELEEMVEERRRSGKTEEEAWLEIERIILALRSGINASIGPRLTVDVRMLGPMEKVALGKIEAEVNRVADNLSDSTGEIFDRRLVFHSNDLDLSEIGIPVTIVGRKIEIKIDSRVEGQRALTFRSKAFGQHFFTEDSLLYVRLVLCASPRENVAFTSLDRLLSPNNHSPWIVKGYHFHKGMDERISWLVSDFSVLD